MGHQLRQITLHGRERIGTSPMSAAFAFAARAILRGVVVGADALDLAHRARPEAGPGAVGDATGCSKPAKRASGNKPESQESFWWSGFGRTATSDPTSMPFCL